MANDSLFFRALLQFDPMSRIKLGLTSAASFAGAVLLWVWLAVKAIVTAIGATTVGDDFDQLIERLPRWAEWLLSTPWWVPSILAVVLTSFLIWLSWPTSTAQAHASRPVSRHAPSRCLLRLKFSGHVETPVEVAKENILSWFVYWTPSHKITKQPEGIVVAEQPPSWVIFIVFEQPLGYGQVIVNFTGGRPSRWQVHQTLESSIVISIDGAIPACELEFITKP